MITKVISNSGWNRPFWLLFFLLSLNFSPSMSANNPRPKTGHHRGVPILNSEIYTQERQKFDPSRLIRNVYITLGPYFEDLKDEVIYRVGMTLDYREESLDKEKVQHIRGYEDSLDGSFPKRKIEQIRLDRETFRQLISNGGYKLEKEKTPREFMEKLRMKEEQQLKNNPIKKIDSKPNPKDEKLHITQKLGQFGDLMRHYLSKIRSDMKKEKEDEQNNITPNIPDSRTFRVQDKDSKVRTPMFYVMRKMMQKAKNMNDSDDQEHKHGQDMFDQSMHSGLMLKTVQMNQRVMEYYQTNCDENFRNCKQPKKKFNANDFQDEDVLSKDTWTLSKGDPALDLTQIFIKVYSGENKYMFAVSGVNEYEYRGFYKGQPIDYRRLFISFNITKDIVNKESFGYEVQYKGEKIKGQFQFKSKVYSKLVQPKIVSMGYHDNSFFGELAISKLMAFQYDLLIIPGNIALDVHSRNFQTGEDYFERMQENFTKAPVMFLPGSHESIDNFAFFNNKFQSLNQNEPFKMDVSHFYVNDVSFYFVNLSKVTLSVFRFPRMFNLVKQLFEKIYEKEKRQKIDPRWRLFVTNEPLACSGVSIDNQKCLKNRFLLRPFEDLAKSFGVDMFISGGTSYYERLELGDFWDMKERRKEHTAMKKEKERIEQELQREKEIKDMEHNNQITENDQVPDKLNESGFETLSNVNNKTQSDIEEESEEENFSTSSDGKEQYQDKKIVTKFNLDKVMQEVNNENIPNEFEDNQSMFGKTDFKYNPIVSKLKENNDLEINQKLRKAQSLKLERPKFFRQLSSNDVEILSRKEEVRNKSAKSMIPIPTNKSHRNKSADSASKKVLFDASKNEVRQISTKNGRRQGKLVFPDLSPIRKNPSNQPHRTNFDIDASSKDFSMKELFDDPLEIRPFSGDKFKQKGRRGKMDTSVEEPQIVNKRTKIYPPKKSSVKSWRGSMVEAKKNKSSQINLSTPDLNDSHVIKKPDQNLEVKKEPDNEIGAKVTPFTMKHGNMSEGMQHKSPNQHHSKRLRREDTVMADSDEDELIGGGYHTKHKLAKFFPTLVPFFDLNRPTHLINVGSAGFSKGFGPKRLNSDPYISKNQKTAIKGFVLLTFLNQDSRVFYIDFEGLEIEDFVLIGSRAFNFLVFKSIFLILSLLGFMSVCVYANFDICLKVKRYFSWKKDKHDFEYLIDERVKEAHQMKEEARTMKLREEMRKKQEEKQKKKKEKEKQEKEEEEKKLEKKRPKKEETIDQMDSGINHEDSEDLFGEDEFSF